MQLLRSARARDPAPCLAHQSPLAHPHRAEPKGNPNLFILVQITNPIKNTRRKLQLGMGCSAPESLVSPAGRGLGPTPYPGGSALPHLVNRTVPCSSGLRLTSFQLCRISSGSGPSMLSGRDAGCADTCHGTCRVMSAPRRVAGRRVPYLPRGPARWGLGWVTLLLPETLGKAPRVAPIAEF